MVNFRFHLVSLVAVFLALGLGVLTGTTVINRGLVAQLEQRTEEIAAESERLRQDVAALRAFSEEATPHLIDGQLAQRDVVLVTEEGADPEAIAGTQGALAEARAEVPALFSIDGGLAELADAQREEVAREIGIDPDLEGEEFAVSVAAALADRLAFGLQPGVADPLPVLLDQGLVRSEGPPLDDVALRELSADAFVVVGGAADPATSFTLVPFVEALAEAGPPVTAVEAVDALQPFVEELRGGPSADSIATQDNVDEVFGQVGLVLSLDGLLDGAEPGHYGVKDGATSVIPPAA